MIGIRQIDETDWRVLREIRLRALAADPAVFSSNAARESSFPESTWRSRLANPNTGIFVLYSETEPAGMTAIVIDRDDPSKQTAMLWGSWLRPDLRGRGLSKLLYEARIGWAESHPTCTRIVVSHRESNIASKHANQRYGFRWIRCEEKRWSDGIAEKEHFYELFLVKTLG